MITFGWALGALLGCDVNPATALPALEQIAGTGDYELDRYEPLANRPLRVFYHVPDDADADTPVVIVMHGQERDADVYRDAWIGAADLHGYIVAAPQFREVFYAGSSGYALGNVFDNGDAPRADGLRDPSQWSFQWIEPLFDDIVARTPTEVEQYQMFGHSAGAQFAHRFVLFVPDGRYEYVVAANAGWYTVPDDAIDYPYGLGLTPLQGGDRSYFDRQLVVHNGDRDTSTTSASLRHTPEADAQGDNRFERGEYFVEQSEALAGAAGEAYAWDRFVVQGVGHSGEGMSTAAAAWLAETLGR